jgi:hypothetical protein
MGLCVKGRQIFRHTRSPVSAIFAVVFSFISIPVDVCGLNTRHPGDIMRYSAC